MDSVLMLLPVLAPAEQIVAAVALATVLMLIVRPRRDAEQRNALVDDDLTPLLQHGRAVICAVEASGAIRSISPNAPALFGAAAERAPDLGARLHDLVAPPEFASFGASWDALWRSCMTDGQAQVVVPSRAPDGATRQIELWACVTDAASSHILVEIRDVTTARADQERGELLERAIAQGADRVIITDAQGCICYVNEAFVRASGHTAESVIGRTPAVLRSDEHQADFFERLWRALKAGRPYRTDIVNRTRTGDAYHEELSLTPLRDGDGNVTHFLSVGRDIGERKLVESDIIDQAYFDPLTGVANVRLLRERSRQILALTRRHGHISALLHVDLDRLRHINETLGRSVGDEVLRVVADRLRQSLRESDTLARLSSDEFLVLLSEVTEEEATARVVRRLRDAICRPCRIQDHSVTIGACIGVALYPQDATTFDELLEYADLALKRAQHSRSDFEFYQREQSEMTHDRLMLEDDLRWAWEHEQFVLHYQPILSGAGEVVGAEALTRGTSNVMGVEALARWPHLERGMVSPAQFIPLAERTGRIVSLDRWAIATAAKQAAAWAQDGWTGWISVNLSARSLHDPELPPYVARTLQVYGVERGRIVLEVTESAAMRDPALTAQLLGELKTAGALVALDDFGIGHSSLAYLRNFPVDLLKLDQSFIREIGDPRNEQLLESLITLAHRMGARIVAEGVEEQHQLDWLRATGCDFIQGFLLGRPAPPENVRPSELRQL
jgi:diguanylate cyclase (GGDEF)-like protein/PAS domain S-box-containing protein